MIRGPSGPFLFPVTAAGLIWVLRSKAAAPWRAIGIAALVGLALVVVSGGKAYYAIGSVPVFMAAGADDDKKAPLPSPNAIAFPQWANVWAIPYPSITPVSGASALLDCRPAGS